ncbi:MAG: caspase family protein [Hyphomicrobiaceae bacterium]
MVRLVFFILLAVASTSALAKQRVALVIGNGAYEYTTPLKNAPNDGKLIIEKLTKLGFKVIGGTDLTKSKMRTALREFARALDRASVVALFFAGHGLQVAGTNYLVPVDANITVAADLEWEAVSMQAILRQMQNRQRTSIIILDACRDNPLSRRLARAMGTRSNSVGRGLARMVAGAGSFIAFSTAPDETALDGDSGKHSPFTAALARYIEQPGLDIAQLFRRVRLDVEEATSGQQVPWSNSSLREDFQFRPRNSDAVKKKPRTSPATSLVQYEITYWNSVKDSSDPQVLQTYIDKYPKGQFSELAKVLISAAKREQANRQQRAQQEAAVRDALAAKRVAEREQGEALKKAFAATREDEYRRALAEAAKSREALKRAEAQRKTSELKAEEARSEADKARTARQETLAAETKIAALSPARAKDLDEQGQRRIITGIQSALRRKTCYSGKIDGVWGPASRRALTRAIGSKLARLGAVQSNLEAVSRSSGCKSRSPSVKTKKSTKISRRRVKVSPSSRKRRTRVTTVKRPSRQKSCKISAHCMSGSNHSDCHTAC